ncbi:MAG: DUF2232 domain-containing protein [Clostridia bacterium]|nr:DUF2232 domain-containing protein [Clostridia bacterium]
MNQNINPTNKKPFIYSAKLPIISMFFAIASMYIPAILFIALPKDSVELFGIAVCALSAFILILIHESVRGVLFPIILLALSGLLGGSFLPGSIVGVYLALIISYAYVITEFSNKSFVASTLLGLALSLLPCGALAAFLAPMELPIAFAVVLSTLPFAILLSYSIKKKLDRAKTVFRMTLGATLFTVVAALALIFVYTRSFSLDAVRGVIDTAREMTVDTMNSAMSALSETLGASGMSIDYEDYVLYATNSVFNLLPAITVISLSFVSYFLHSLMIGAYYKPDELKNDPQKTEEFSRVISLDMTSGTAGIFIVGLILALTLGSGKTELVATACLNLILMITPGLCLTTLAFISALSKVKGPSCLASLLYIFTLFMLLSLSPIAIMTIAFAGSVIIIIKDIKIAISNKKNK